MTGPAIHTHGSRKLHRGDVLSEWVFERWRDLFPLVHRRQRRVGWIGSQRWTTGAGGVFQPRWSTQYQFRQERRQFLGYCGKFAMYGLVAESVVRVTNRMGPGYELFAQSETIRELAAGNHQWIGGSTRTIGGQSFAGGTSGNIIVIRPQAGAVVNLYGDGATHEGAAGAWCRIDGSTGANGMMTFDTSLNTAYPNAAYGRGIDLVSSSNVTYRGIYFKGVDDHHGAFNTCNIPCGEERDHNLTCVSDTDPCNDGGHTSTQSLSKSAITQVGAGVTNFALEDCILADFRTWIGTVRSQCRLVRCLLTNCESSGGPTNDPTGDANWLYEMVSCVAWEIPNHGIAGIDTTLGTESRLDIQNCVFGTCQDNIGIGGFVTHGCGDFICIHNTFYMPNQDFEGQTDPGEWNEATKGLPLVTHLLLSFGATGAEVRDQRTVRNNVFTITRNFGNKFIGMGGSTVVNNDSPFDIDYNLYHVWFGPQTCFSYDNNNSIDFAAWKAALIAAGYPNAEANSLNQQAPTFVNPPTYTFPRPTGTPDAIIAANWGYEQVTRTPAGIAAFRARLELADGTLGTPGNNPASDGLKRGINVSQDGGAGGGGGGGTGRRARRPLRIKG